MNKLSSALKLSALLNEEMTAVSDEHTSRESKN